MESAQGVVSALPVGVHELGDHLSRKLLGVQSGVRRLPIEFREGLDAGSAQLDVATPRLAFLQVLDVIGVEREPGHVGGRRRVLEKPDLEHAGALLELHHVPLPTDVVLWISADLHHSQDPGLRFIFGLDELRDRVPALDRCQVLRSELVSLQVLRERSRRGLYRGARDHEGRQNQQRVHQKRLLSRACGMDGFERRDPAPKSSRRRHGYHGGILEVNFSRLGCRRAQILVEYTKV